MIRKAIIKEINNDIFLVRIPDFESPGDNSEYLAEAILCYQPGNLEGYFINDIVFVAFDVL